MKQIRLSAPAVSRVELATIAVLLLCGFAVRAWQLSGAGLNHFDEGVYVFSALGLADHTQPRTFFPEQVRFSPPVFPFLVAMAYRVAGSPWDTAAIFVNVLLGTLSIATLWWAGRTWFGPPAGAAAAALLAFSNFHIAFSRTALTDVAFALFFFAALWVGVRALASGNTATAAAAGLITGLAWNTKYHGWFALVITGAAMTPALWEWVRRRAPFPARPLRAWVVMSAVAAACYVPWALFIQSQPGGYAALAKYQRSMINSHYLYNFLCQVRGQMFWEGTASRCSLIAALLAALLCASRPIPVRRAAIMAAVLLAAAFTIGAAGGTAVLALAAIPVLWRAPQRLAGRILIASTLLWLLMTPLYRPYSRLVMPFTITAFLAAGFVLSKVLESEGERTGRTWKPALLALAALLAFFPFAAVSASSMPRSQRSFSAAAALIENYVPAGSQVLVIGEPALAFYLHLDNRPAFEHVEDAAALAHGPAPVYVVTGLYAKWSPELRQLLKKVGARLLAVAAFPLQPNGVRLLDDMPADRARAFAAHPDEMYQVTLYRLLPAVQLQ